MNNDDLDRERYEIQLQEASSALAVVDRMISGDPEAVLSVTHLNWIRALLLDDIDASEAALGLEQSQTADDVQRTISLGLDAGIIAALEEQQQPTRHLPVAENRNTPGMHWLLHLPCPECGEPGVEQTGSDIGGGDHEAVTVYPDRDEYDSPIGTRGGYTRIDLWCSMEHHFALIIANHKGTEYIGAVSSAKANGQDDAATP